jgi:predicted dehydrogenase
MAEAKARIGLVGAGAWGKNYVRNLAALGALHAVCDQNEQALAWVKAQFPQVHTCQMLDELLALEQLDAAVVATPTPEHYPTAKRLLEAGKHCLVEKPLTHTTAMADELCCIAEQRGLTLMVGHILLYHPVVQHLKGAIDRGEFGDVYYISAVRANLGQIRRTENAMWSLAPHDISVAQHLFGANPLRVSATGQAFVQHEAGIHDLVYLTLFFGDGRLANITSSWLDPEKVRLIKVVGSTQMAVFDDMDPRYMLQIHDKSVDWDKFSEPVQGSALKVRTGDVRIPFIKPSEPLKEECQDFIRSIEMQSVPRATGRQGLANVRILAAADESLRHGGAPVETGL